MTNFSKRFLRGRPMRLTTTATLDQILDAMKSQRPDLNSARRGWGSILEDPDIIGSLELQPPITDPEIMPAIAGRRPEILVARLYWFRELRRRVRPGGVRLPSQHQLAATDVLISSEGNNEYLLFVASTADKEVDQMLPALKNAILSTDPNVMVNSSTSSLDFEHADFFMWLVRQRFEGNPVSATTDVDDIDHVRVFDALQQTTALGHRLHQGRLELMTLLANSDNRFGPARFSISDSATGLACEVELAVNASFDVTVTGITYANNPFQSALDLRLMTVCDLLFSILPAMKVKYLADRGWLSGADRDAFRALMKRRATAGVARL